MGNSALADVGEGDPMCAILPDFDDFNEVRLHCFPDLSA
jgi:hypothetical protein